MLIIKGFIKVLNCTNCTFREISQLHIFMTQNTTLALFPACVAQCTLAMHTHSVAPAVSPQTIYIYMSVYKQY